MIACLTAWSGVMEERVGASKRKFRIQRKFRLQSSGLVTSGSVSRHWRDGNAK
jgi:hypothetical protein